VDIPGQNDPSFIEYGCEPLEVAYNFYGKPADDTYEDRSVHSPPLINCTFDSLKLEYGGYKNYVANRKIALKEEFVKKEASIKARMLAATANKYQTK